MLVLRGWREKVVNTTKADTLQSVVNITSYKIGGIMIEFNKIAQAVVVVAALTTAQHAGFCAQQKDAQTSEVTGAAKWFPKLCDAQNKRLGWDGVAFSSLMGMVPASIAFQANNYRTGQVASKDFFRYTTASQKAVAYSLVVPLILTARELYYNVSSTLKKS